MSEQIETLGDALPKEIERCQEIVRIYKSVPNGQFAAAFMEKDIKDAIKAMMTGDIVEMLRLYGELKQWEM